MSESRLVTAAIRRGGALTVAACPNCAMVCVAPTSWRARQMRRQHIRRDHESTVSEPDAVPVSYRREHEMSRRKELHPDCDGGIFCPVADHVETVGRAGRWKIQHVPLTQGQRHTLHERSMERLRERHAYIESRHGSLLPHGEAYSDGTHWKVAEQEWQQHKADRR